MAHANELERLEGFVSRLLAGYKALKEKNERLSEEIKSRDEIISRLRKDLSIVDKERAEVSGKITKLIDRIEHWESELTSADIVLEASDDNNSRVQGNLFALESDNIKSGE